MAKMKTMCSDLSNGRKRKQTEGGCCSNVSGFVRSPIRKAQELHSAVAELQQLISEGLASGPSEPFDLSLFLSKMR